MIKTITSSIKCPNCGEEIDISEDLVRVSNTLKDQIQQEWLLKLKEKDKIVDDLKFQLGDALRRAEQSSMQRQGEVQEIAIVDILNELYPCDEITQSKKGSNGADVMQLVRLQNGSEAGKIYYESKRTKTWSNDWVSKFKEDSINAGADVLVLVTNAFPKNIQKFGFIDGVWICAFENVKELSLVLRIGLIKLHSVLVTQNEKDSKMQLLYSYLTSKEFHSVFESIIAGFKDLQTSHQEEKIKMQRFWKEREKTLEKVLSNSIEFYTTIRGISGSETPEIKMLESSSVD